MARCGSQLGPAFDLKAARHKIEKMNREGNA